MTTEPLVPQQNHMTYDGENRMTAVTGGAAAGYTYDGNGLRVAKAGGGTTTVSIFSGSSVIAEYDNGAAPSAPSREYIYNPAGGATTGLLAMIANGATTYYHQDHLSVRLTTDGTPGSPTYGQVLSQQGSYPYGEQWYQSGPGNKWFFTSYNRDSETGLDYALARYYDSRTGTFCSADPLAGSPDDPQSWNRYPYGRNNPIGNIDPSGKGWLSWLLDAGAIAAAIFAPEIDDFLGGLLGAQAGAGGSAAAATADYTPVLVTRGALNAATVAADGADGAASAASGVGDTLAVAAAAGSAADDQPRKSTSPNGAAPVVNPNAPNNPHNQCPPGTYADTSGTPDYQGGATEYGVNADGTPTRFAGRRTASGSIFDPWGYTAATIQGPPGARWTIPKNTFLNVVSANNPGSNVVVQVTDTGILGPGDVIDLSAGAMKTLTGKAFNSVPVKMYTCRAR